MVKRSLIALCGFLICFTLIYLQIFRVATNVDLQEVAAQNSTYVLHVDDSRGQIYDCNFEPLVNEEDTYFLAVMSTPEAMTALLDTAVTEERETLLRHFESQRPFLYRVDSPYVEGDGITLITAKRRYSNYQTAAHMIGYIDGDRIGVSGIEKAYDAELDELSGTLSVAFEVDAQSGALQGVEPVLRDSTYNRPQGIILTLDKTIQSIVEQVGSSRIEKGSIIVMDVETGQIKAAASFPSYNPNDVAAYLEDENAALINRSLSTFNVGSIFKLSVMSAALEAGIAPDYTYECKGYIEVDGTIFRCNNLAGHGVIDMDEATQVSCNPYFIHLAMEEIGSARTYQTAVNLGFAKVDEIAPGFKSAQGSLPSLEDLKNTGEFANFAFGQGKLTATPIQIAKLISAIANGGQLVNPTITLGLSDQAGTSLLHGEGNVAPIQVMGEDTAKTIRDFMENVVLTGSGTNALPEYGGAGGKTGSAQTGTYDSDGEEIVHAWFAGYFPAEQPRYAVVILNEGADSGSSYSAPLFKEIADRINKYDSYRNTWQKQIDHEEKLLDGEKEPDNPEDEESEDVESEGNESQDEEETDNIEEDTAADDDTGEEEG